MGLLTQQQANQDCEQSQLAFQLWEVILSKEQVDLSNSLDDQANAESLYWSQLKDQEATLPDLKTALMAILKYNDGKRFVEGSNAPLPQSENEIGFRVNGKLTFRYEELPLL